MNIILHGEVEAAMPPFINTKQQRQQTIYLKVPDQMRNLQLTLFEDDIDMLAGFRNHKEIEFVCDIREVNNPKKGLIKYINVISLYPVTD